MIDIRLNNINISFANQVLEEGRKMVRISRREQKEIPAIIFGKYERKKENEKNKMENRMVIEECQMVPSNKITSFSNKRYELNLEYSKEIENDKKIMGKMHPHLIKSPKCSLTENISSDDLLCFYTNKEKELNLTYFLDNSFIIYFTTRELGNKIYKLRKWYDQEMMLESGVDHDEWCRNRFISEYKDIIKNLEIKLIKPDITNLK